MRSHSLRSGLVTALSVFALALVAAGPARAQQGAITGTVTSTSTGQPLAGVQVLVVGTGLGTIADDEGAYRISGVPAGEQQVRVQLLGYGTRTRSVTVEAGQASTLDFSLSQSAVELDQIVVTGTGTGGIQQKKLGNTIGTIDASELENVPTTSVTEMLSAREPGLNMLASSGMNDGQRIRIRGAASLTQSNEPIVYIDGVRASSGGGFAGRASADITNEGTGASSRLDDLNPDAIERIEVLKGAAAATLYGTEASNGVIQIFTKSGREGPARWNFEVEQGAEVMPTNRIVPHADFARNQAQLDRMRQRWDAPDLQMYEVLEREIFTPLVETGRLTNLSGSVSGGGEGVTYFASSRYSNIDGIMGLESLTENQDKQERWQAAANINAFTSDNLRVNLSSNYSFIQGQTVPQGNETVGAFASQFWAQLRLANCTDPAKACNRFGSPVFVSPEEAVQIEVGQEVHHFRFSLQGQYNPSQSLSANATFGADVITNDSWEHRPFGWNINGIATEDIDGRRDIGTQNDVEVTTELRTGWETTFGEDFSSSLTAGTQGFLRQSRLRGGSGDGFGGPGLEVAGAASQLVLDESITETVNIGIFAQEQVGYKNFAYFTVGGRYDVNSAFGEETQGEFYPKASLSLVFSDLAGWDNETLSTLRLRGAWGESGLQPASFAQFRTFSGVGSLRGPGVEPQNLGNPALKPEVTTEYEAGVNLGLLNDRISVEGTFWTRTTNDALAPRQFPESGGFTNRQVVNIAQLDGHGLDFSVNAAAIQGEDFALNVFANTAYLSQTISDMGGIPAICVSCQRNRNFLKEGFAPGAFFGATLQRDEEIPLDLNNTCTAPTREEALEFFSQPRNPSTFEVLPNDCGEPDMLRNFLGSPWPDWSGSAGFDVRFLGNFHFRTTAEYSFGQQKLDQGAAFRRSNRFIGRNTPQSAQITSTLVNPNSTAEERLEAAQVWARELRALAPMSGMNEVWDADWIRWREASLTYDVPSSFASKLSMRTLSVSFQGRNIAQWVTDDYPGLDPELESVARCGGGGQAVSLECNFVMGNDKFRIPIPRRFVLSVSAGF